ncbi:GerAB/ArcD/ProY family transporter [Brevibacillus daliensis]|uniref:GerAB/ArcD/ProY family transporter n=1 Tax=Brevibacillus daliensis TaxID=2892995 RepID=UPI001E462E6D|nr:endospore germination permease [Brevibacillus daliensis]
MSHMQSNKISNLQFTLFIASTQIGLGILYIPRDLMRVAGTDGWVSVILSWILATTANLIIIQLMKRIPGLTIRTALQRYCGKWIGGLFYLFIIAYLIFFSFLIVSAAVFIVQVWILQRIPAYYIMLLLVAPIFYLCCKGVKIMGRYVEITTMISIWMPFLLFIPLYRGNLLYFLPLIKDGLLPILKGVGSTLFFFLGFEMTMFLYPYLETKEKASFNVIVANTISMSVLMLVTIVNFSYFSPTQLMDTLWPTLSLLRIITFPFLERLEVIFLSFYLVSFSTTWVTYTFFSIYGLTGLFKRSLLPKHFFYFLALFVISSFFFTLSYNDIMRYVKYSNILGFFVGYVFPILFISYLYFFQDRIDRRRQTCDQKK